MPWRTLAIRPWRLPMWGTQPRRHGKGSGPCTRRERLGSSPLVLTVPLLIRDGAIGAVKVYSREPFNYDERSQHIMELFAQQAGTVLTDVKDYAEAQELGDQLREALESRDMIGMAKGILMSRENVDESTAFYMLRQLSQNENIKLRDVAFRLLRSARAAG
jgi:hypothetical protein